MSFSELMMLVNNDIHRPLNEIVGNPGGMDASSMSIYDYLRMQNIYLKKIAQAVDSAFVIHKNAATLGKSAAIINQSGEQMVLLSILCDVHIPSGQSATVNLSLTTDQGYKDTVLTENGKFWLRPDLSFQQEPVEMWLPLKTIRLIGGCTASSQDVVARVDIEFSTAK